LELLLRIPRRMNQEEEWLRIIEGLNNLLNKEELNNKYNETPKGA